MSPIKSIAGALALLFSSACATLNQAPYSVLLQGDNLDILSDQVVAVGGEVTHQLPVIDGIGAKLSQTAIDQLQGSQKLERLIVDQGLTERSQGAMPIHPVAQWFESTSDRLSINAQLADLTGAAALHQLGSTGKGVGIAILDTGLWVDPEDQRSLNLPHYNAITDSLGDNIDLDGHGSHLASLIRGVEQQFKGIAPNATLIDIKAFDRLGEANFLDVIRGIQWAIQHRRELNIRVLNVSISASPELAYWLDPVNQALTAAWHAVITVVVAAGNGGPEH
ncbi:MAG: S8 family serine peptidase, partial [Luminiphilus sp.]|nr:S8 family serine peptidase [Luminiphilus sp.]